MSLTKEITGIPVGGVGRQLGLEFAPGEAPLALGSLPSVAEALATVPEHRHPRGYQAAAPPYPLVPMLLLLLVGVLCGRRGYGSIAEWAESVGRVQPAILDALGCPTDRERRTPVAATLFRCVRDLDRAAFQGVLQTWIQATAQALGPARTRLQELADQLTLDGKTVRGATSRQAGAAVEGDVGVHLVAVYAPALQIVVDQMETAGKGHELAAVEVLLGRLPLAGRVITGDALLTQRSICTTILDGGGDYLFPVKDNQPTLLADLETAFFPGGPGGSRDDRTGAGCGGERPTSGAPS